MNEAILFKWIFLVVFLVVAWYITRRYANRRLQTQHMSHIETLPLTHTHHLHLIELKGDHPKTLLLASWQNNHSSGMSLLQELEAIPPQPSEIKAENKKDLES